MANQIALPDGIHHKAIVETIPYPCFTKNGAKYLISGTVVNSMLKGYCEITVISSVSFYAAIAFFNENGRIQGYTLCNSSGYKHYEIVNNSETTSFSVSPTLRKLRLISFRDDNRTTTFTWEINTSSIREQIGVAYNAPITSEFRGSADWFDAIIDVSDWNFLKNRSIIGKTERVPEDPFYIAERVRHLQFNAPNSAPVENVPAGIQ